MAALKHRPSARGGGPGLLAALLAADRFRLGPETGHVARNLERWGGAVDGSAAAWVGNDLPPHGAPSVSLGAGRGTLGPFSFGFLDNARGVFAYAAPLARRPSSGPIAIVCGPRQALPDIAPLAVARRLGVSWIISVGDGDPAETLAFLAADPATRAVLFAPSPSTQGSIAPSLVSALRGKPLVVLGGDPLLRAAARRAGGAGVEEIETWLAHGALLEAGVARPERPLALVAGGGASLLRDTARIAGIDLPIRAIDDDDPAELAAALATGSADSDLLLVAGEIDAPLPPHALWLDLGQPDRLRALLGAMARRALPAAPLVARPTGAAAHAAAILAEAGPLVGDHDTKRILKSYGVRVTRQAPASSATAAGRVAAQVGLPCVLVAGSLLPVEREHPRVAETTADARRAASLILEGAPFVLVRERLPDAPRAHVRTRRADDTAWIEAAPLDTDDTASVERALLPLDGDEARLLARAAAGKESGDDLADTLVRIAQAASDGALALDLELYVGAEGVAVASASARRDR